MIKACKAFFLGRLLREKILMVAFIVLGAAIWLSAFGDRAGRFWREHKAIKATLASQQQWLDSREMIDARSREAIAKLDPARTLNDTRLLGEINAIANGVGLRSNVATNEARTERTSQFAVNSLHVTVTKASYETLRNLYFELQKRSPYIGLEEFSLQVDPANRKLLNASLRVSSVEIIR